MKYFIKCTLVAIIFLTIASCSRPAKNFGNGIISKHNQLLVALNNFENYPTSGSDCRIVTDRITDLIKYLNLVNLQTIEDIKKMSNEEANKWAQNVNDDLIPIKIKIKESMRSIKSKIPSNENAPKWDPFTGNPYYGLPVYQIQGERFYFMDGTSGYDIESIMSEFNCKKYLLAFRK